VTRTMETCIKAAKVNMAKSELIQISGAQNVMN